MGFVTPRKLRRALDRNARETADVRTGRVLGAFGKSHHIVEPTVAGGSELIVPNAAGSTFGPNAEVLTATPGGRRQRAIISRPPSGQGGDLPPFTTTKEIPVTTNLEVEVPIVGDSYLVIHYLDRPAVRGGNLRIGFWNNGNITEIYDMVTIPNSDTVPNPDLLDGNQGHWAVSLIHDHTTVPDGSFVILASEGAGNATEKLYYFDIEAGTFTLLVDATGGGLTTIDPSSVLYNAADEKVYYNRVVSVTSNVSRVNLTGTIETLQSYISPTSQAPVRAITGPEAIQLFYIPGE